MSPGDAPAGSAASASVPASTGVASAGAALSDPSPTPLPASTTTHTVRFPNDVGDILVGTLTVPACGGSRAAVLCHGFRDSKAAPLLAEVAAGLAAVGVASLRIDFRGCGESGGEWAFGNYAEEAADVAAAVEWLRTGGGGSSGGSDSDRGGNGDDPGRRWSVDAVAGHSKGAGSVLLYASRNAFPGLVVNIAGRFHMRDGVRRRLGEDRWAALWRDGTVAMPGYTVTRESVEARFALDMGVIAAGLSPEATLLTIHGDKDDVIPVADAAAYVGVVPLGARHTARILEGACHKFVDYRPVVAAAIVEAFVGRFG
ncbi:hypothetical protein MMPV_008634 [Pyropia vietnamensis]